MNIVWLSLGAYLLAGLLAILILDTITGRVRKKLILASSDTRGKLLESGTFVGAKTAVILTLGALFLFWPALIWAAIRKSDGGDNG